MTDLNVSINANANDGHANEDGSSWTNSAQEVVLGNDGSASPKHAFLRFENVTIPKDSNIESAHIRFQAEQNGGTVVLLNIAIEAADDPAAPTTGAAGLVGGGTAASTKDDTAGGGTLFCESQFSGGAEAVMSGSVLKVTVSITCSNA